MFPYPLLKPNKIKQQCKTSRTAVIGAVKAALFTCCCRMRLLHMTRLEFALRDSKSRRTYTKPQTTEMNMQVSAQALNPKPPKNEPTGPQTFWLFADNGGTDLHSSPSKCPTKHGFYAVILSFMPCCRTATGKTLNPKPPKPPETQKP